MIKYKHYSFDLWLTLIKSNPEFKRKRAEYFQEHFNRTNKSIKEIEAIIKRVDLMCNWINETTGGCITPFEMYAMVLHLLDYDLNPLSVRDLQSIYVTIESIFFKYMPQLYDDSILSILSKLKKSGATISTLSNTGFIGGQTMRIILKHIGVAGFIDFQIYSDELGCSKPNSLIFSAMIQSVNQLRIHNPCRIEEIIHIGDNEHADFMGAQRAGVNSIKINGLSISEIL
jgi:putative hydrolase of the HAD superfamily